MRLLGIAVVITVVVTSAPARADVEVAGYVHSSAGAPPAFDRDQVAAMLLDGTWAPIAKAGAKTTAPKLRFTGSDQARAAAGERLVGITRIESRDKLTVVAIDGKVYVLETCAKDAKTACLTRRADLSLESPEAELVRLRKENADLRRENERLKKEIQAEVDRQKAELDMLKREQEQLGRKLK